MVRGPRSCAEKNRSGSTSATNSAPFSLGRGNQAVPHRQLVARVVLGMGREDVHRLARQPVAKIFFGGVGIQQEAWTELGVDEGFESDQVGDVDRLRTRISHANRKGGVADVGNKHMFGLSCPCGRVVRGLVGDAKEDFLRGGFSGNDASARFRIVRERNAADRCLGLGFDLILYLGTAVPVRPNKAPRGC